MEKEVEYVRGDSIKCLHGNTRRQYIQGPGRSDHAKKFAILLV